MTSSARNRNNIRASLSSLFKTLENNDIIKEISSSVFYKYAKDYFKVKSFFPIYISDIIVNKKKINAFRHQRLEWSLLCLPNQ